MKIIITMIMVSGIQALRQIAARHEAMDTLSTVSEETICGISFFTLCHRVYKQ